MIFFSINQLYSFCLILFCGILGGLIYSIFCVFLIKNHQNKLISFIFNFLTSIFVGILLTFSVNIFYFGQFNLIIILSFFIGFIWSTKTLRFLLDFFETKVYYIYNKSFKYIKLYLVRKHESIKD